MQGRAREEAPNLLGLRRILGRWLAGSGSRSIALREWRLLTGLRRLLSVVLQAERQLKPASDARKEGNRPELAGRCTVAVPVRTWPIDSGTRSGPAQTCLPTGSGLAVAGPFAPGKGSLPIVGRTEPLHHHLAISTNLKGGRGTKKDSRSGGLSLA